MGVRRNSTISSILNNDWPGTVHLRVRKPFWATRPVRLPFIRGNLIPWFFRELSCLPIPNDDDVHQHTRTHTTTESTHQYTQAYDSIVKCYNWGSSGAPKRLRDRPRSLASIDDRDGRDTPTWHDSVSQMLEDTMTADSQTHTLTCTGESRRHSLSLSSVSDSQSVSQSADGNDVITRFKLTIKPSIEKDSLPQGIVCLPEQAFGPDREYNIYLYKAKFIEAIIIRKERNERELSAPSSRKLLLPT